MTTTSSTTAASPPPPPAPPPTPQTPSGAPSPISGTTSPPASTTGDNAAGSALTGATTAETIAASPTTAERLADATPAAGPFAAPAGNVPADDLSAETAAITAATANQQQSRGTALTAEQRAVLGYQSAQGADPANNARHDVVKSAADIISNAAPDDRAKAQALVRNLGAAIEDGRLIPGERFRQVMFDAANAAPGSNLSRGAMAHLERAAQVLNQTPLAAGTALAFDPPPPQNAAQEANNRATNNGGTGAPAAPPDSAEARANLPQLDRALVDADLYYRHDNRGTALRVADNVFGGATNAQQPLTIESVKSSANAFAREVNGPHSTPGVYPSEQVQRQQAWTNDGTMDQPRQFRAATAATEGYHQLMNGDSLRLLGTMTQDWSARNITLGDRSYSLNELNDIRINGQPEVTARVNVAVADAQARGRTVTPQVIDGMTASNREAVYGDAPPAKNPDGRLIGQPVEPLRTPQPTDLPGARQGGAFGAVASFGVSTATAFADGRVTSNEARQIATETATGAALGAVSAKAEQIVTPAIDRALAARSGPTVAGNLGTSLGSRVLGSTVVGAVVTAGTSAYVNREGLARGDSQAVGNVAADTVIGAGSVAAGAAVGSVVGAAVAGAAIGSAVPGLGTAVGFVVGVGIGVGITYAAQISGVRDSIASGVASAWNGLKGVFS
jgi:hypothetical protein